MDLLDLSGTLAKCPWWWTWNLSKDVKNSDSHKDQLYQDIIIIILNTNLPEFYGMLLVLLPLSLLLSHIPAQLRVENSSGLSTLLALDPFCGGPGRAQKEFTIWYWQGSFQELGFRYSSWQQDQGWWYQIWKRGRETMRSQGDFEGLCLCWAVIFAS